MKTAKEVFPRALVIFVIMMLLCGFVYTMAVTGIGRALFRDKANGSVIEINGVKYGSTLLGQQYTDQKHMWGRIMLTDTGTFMDDEGNPVMYAWASNKTPAGEELEQAVAERVAMIKEANPAAEVTSIPVDLVTCSGSGLDPHISPAAAEYQVPRLAKENNMTEEEVRAIIDKYTTGRFLGIFGEKTVNVLQVNLALDGILE